ncbi:MbcA/ParS/Xre antitoxin family protein [Pseudomonas putida]
MLDLTIPIKGSRRAAFKWLETPNDFLANQTPMNMLATPQGLAQLLSYIERWLEHKRTE